MYASMFVCMYVSILMLFFLVMHGKGSAHQHFHYKLTYFDNLKDDCWVSQNCFNLMWRLLSMKWYLWCKPGLVEYTIESPLQIIPTCSESTSLFLHAQLARKVHCLIEEVLTVACGLSVCLWYKLLCSCYWVSLIQEVHVCCTCTSSVITDGNNIWIHILHV